MKNKIEEQYIDLLRDILLNGVEKEARNGSTLSVFGRQLRHNMSDGFPLLTTKKMYFSGIVTELLWFLRGDTCIKYLVDNDCHIWDGDAYVNYLKKCKHDINSLHLSKEEFIERIKTDDKFAEKWGSLGPIYGFSWRNWNGKSDKEFNDEFGNKGIDQIAELIRLLKETPDSRRMVVSAWAVHNLPNMVLPPCHYGFQIWTKN